MMKTPIRVVVTGAAGQIGYALSFRIASGQMFGPDTPVILHLLEIPPMEAALKGVVMELDDCAFPSLQSIVPTVEADEGFRAVNWALLVGSVPRKPGMDRADLLTINGKIFVTQGQKIQQHAASDVQVLAVGNPCNTNCLIAMHNAPDVPRERWFAMTRLDENRARTQLAQRAHVPVTDVERMAVWGNHSSTMFPDFTNARIGGQPASAKLERDWLEGEFLTTVQERGAAIMRARGASSAASAANGVVDSVVAATTVTSGDEWHSLCVASDGSYGVDEGLICSFPTRYESGRVQIVQGVELDDYARQKIAASVDELRAEKALVSDLLPS